MKRDAKLDQLLMDFANANFDCGHYSVEDKNFEKSRQKANRIHAKIREHLEENYNITVTIEF